MEVDYYSKYLKYKNKYTELKKQLGGDHVNSGAKCDKKSYKACIIPYNGCHWNDKKCVKTSCKTDKAGERRDYNSCSKTTGCIWKTICLGYTSGKRRICTNISEYCSEK